MAELIDIKSIREGYLPDKLALMDKENLKYRQRAVKISRMVNMYRLELPLINPLITQQKFWLRWAMRYGKRIQKNTKIFDLFYRTFAIHFSLYELGSLTIFLSLLICFLTRK